MECKSEVLVAVVNARMVLGREAIIQALRIKRTPKKRKQRKPLEKTVHASA